MPDALAIIELDFDPIARLGELAVRWETLGVAVATLAALLLGARIARQTPVDQDADERTGLLGPQRHDHLRRDDLLFVALGAVPGAVVGGRIGYGILHADFYAAQPAALFDPLSGSLELGGAILGASISAAIVGSLLEAPISRWFHVAALPMLLAIGLGKAALAIGGTGQGLPSTLAWATAYSGPGPWGSLAADVASHPAQLYEALVTALVLVVLMAFLAGGAFARRDGRVFAAALALWAVGRAGVATLWRDPAVVGPLNAGQLVAIGIVVIAGVSFIAAPRLTRRAVRKRFDDDEPEPSWPDPATRPRF